MTDREPAVAVRRATRDDVNACALVLTRAFHDDPGVLVFAPDEALRERVLPNFFRTFVAASVAEDADIMVAGEPIVGVASWFGPDTHGPSPDAFADVVDALGPEGTQRLLAMAGELEAQHERLAQERHLRLEFFGVEPRLQRTGVGSALIAHGHRRADGSGVPCYLETFTEQNVRYYERRGYRIAGEYAVGDGVPVYGLLRAPGTPGVPATR
jgi:GNAT superfamily N-acetyltransferase